MPSVRLLYDFQTTLFFRQAAVFNDDGPFQSGERSFKRDRRQKRGDAEGNGKAAQADHLGEW